MRFAQRLNSIKPSLTLAVNAKAMELKAQGVKVTSLAIGEPDFPTPQHIKDAAKAAIDADFTKYTAVPGIPELRTAVGAYMEREFGVAVPMESVIVSVGGKHAGYNLMQALLDPGDEVLIPSPYWLSYPPMVELADGVAVTVHAGADKGFKITTAMLEEKVTPRTRMLIINSPSNPTGAVYTQAELDAQVEWALGKGLVVVSDEIYEQLVFPPMERTSALKWFRDRPEQVVILNGLSKTFAMTGWRVGYTIGHPDLVKKLSTLQGQSTSNICSIAQKAALAALTGPMDCVGVMRDAFARRRDIAMDRISKWPWAVCPKPDGAFYVFVDVHACYGGKVKDSVEICSHLLEDAQVALTPGVAFGDDNCVRISYAVGDEVLKDALEKVEKSLKALAG
ncbi:MAG: pyridoxal phosphate-dependent aminotransferase [Desulfovibrio sp.]|jgi:aspartate aminotransferase|nr:pyridoxal phosphate-dependent aminotransferase [Desulfovibrio sp.]